MKYQVLSTTKVLINEWQTLRDLLIKKTAKADVASTLLTDKQINDAFLGPWHIFFESKLSAYATLMKIRLKLTSTQDEALKSGLKNVNLPKNIEKITIGDLDKIQNQLDALAKTHFEQWETLLTEWNQHIIMGLMTNQIALSEIEINHFKEQEPLSELFDRYTDLNLKTPEWEVTDFKTYLQQKAYLAIHSCLSRQHQAHEPEEVNKVLKLLKKEFNAIAADEKKCAEEQQTETSELTRVG